MSTLETFAAELEALVDKYGHSLNDNEVISTLEEALSRAWGFACEPQPASLFEHAPELLATAKEFQRATQDRINRSFVEAAFDPTDWRRVERDLLTVIAKIEGA